MIKIIRDKILNYTGTDWVPIVIVGNKSDLHGQRQISTEEGEELAALWNCQSVESSAKHNENIGKICPPCFSAFHVKKGKKSWAYSNISLVLLSSLFFDPSPVLFCYFVGRVFELMIGEIEKSTNVPEDPKSECLLL